MLHLSALLAETDVDGDPDTLASLVLGAISPGVMSGLRREPGVGVADLQRAALALLRGVTKA